jgi:hypothetical protein
VRALLHTAARALPGLAPEVEAPALAAIDAFVADPGPARFLHAHRVLEQARRQARVVRASTTLAARSLERGLDRIRSLPFFDEELAKTLASLPCDSRAGRRLSALAALLDAHQELAARVRTVDAERSTRYRPYQPERPVIAARRIRRKRPKR